MQLARTLHPRAGVIVFSGYSDDMLQAEARNLGAAWLLKPLDLAALREHLERFRDAEDDAGESGLTD